MRPTACARRLRTARAWHPTCPPGAWPQQRTDEGQAVVIEEQRQVIAALSARLKEVEQKLVAAPTETDR